MFSIFHSICDLFASASYWFAAIKPYLFVTCMVLIPIYVFRDKLLNQVNSVVPIPGVKNPHMDTENIDRLRREALLRRLGNKFPDKKRGDKTDNNSNKDDSDSDDGKGGMPSKGPCGSSSNGNSRFKLKPLNRDFTSRRGESNFRDLSSLGGPVNITPCDMGNCGG
ncbi:hypothetical protein H4219_004209 [Mycoemilia scoparia]|uniref:Uncharacterized protein n=1 Tax=Mycoemilia scoparia TaxID=417184 RepID=A0A9W7ZWV0_9FUNG|nr:hypothetical protein H4219_004209 [Mycoemilia scoparia]